MRMIIEARIVGRTRSDAALTLTGIERANGDLTQFGLNLSDGRELMQEVQRVLVNAQTGTLVEALTHCQHYQTTLSVKALHTIQYRTVFGKIAINSPQLRRC